ncbi:MAG: hypothetical protein FJX71_01090 [Alphaproteobacteria bacterium]|nr:hypothetical protein [Alphaproteobacteria bacterium]
MTGTFIRFCFFFLFAFLSTQSPNTIWAADDNAKKQTLGTSPAAAAASPSLSTVKIEEVEDIDTSQKPVLSPQLHSHKMPFKLGFEFQESSGLCPWGLTNFTLQRKPILLVANKMNAKSLWHIVIDTNDIEFVTNPFSDHEYEDLAICMDSILSALNILEGLLSKQQSVTFLAWTEQITTDLSRHCLISCSPLFNKVSNQNITKPTPNWKPVISPQVTIQHPLQYTIPLFFGIFGFDSPLMLTFCASLPFRDLFEKAQREANSELFDKIIEGYRKPLSGLMFLHALTLVRMTPDEELTDEQFLNETLEGLESYHQVDPKMKLTLMSRRPISAMFKDLHLSMNYQQTFMQAMGMNFGFRASFNVPKLFPKANYAEQFFDQASGQIVSLERFLALFTPQFVAKNEGVLMKLLKNGVMSTTMLRNMKEEVHTSDDQSVAHLHQGYFEASVKTIETPTRRYIIKIAPPGIQSSPSNHDALSPPWFLESDNSMGAYKQEMNPQEARYGGAIVEARGIKFVHSWFYKKAKLKGEPNGRFLTKSDSQLKHEALALFGFLREFATPQDLADITLGMSYAILKH